MAHAVRADSNARGARPFDAPRDLAGVARLLEEAFRSEHTFPLSDTPLLREVGIVLWTMSYAPVFPENVTGFVWVEEGRIVGNVTISQDEGRLDRYLISNVAVKPSYRRQGIARSLMEISIEHLRTRGAKWTLLNVRPNNPGAVALYRGLNFREIETRGEWTNSSLDSANLPLSDIGSALRSMRSVDHYRASELLRAATPSAVQQFRTPRVAEFGPSWEDRVTETLSDFFTGQVTRRWVLERDRRFAALVMVRGQRFATPHYMAIQVHPESRGTLENDLVAFALREIARFPKRTIRAPGSSTHPELIKALEKNGFEFWNGLTLMALSIT